MKVAETRNDPTFKNVKLDRLRGVLKGFLKASHAAAPKTTLDNENSAWNKYWLPYCEFLGIEPVLNDPKAHSGEDSDGFQLYSAIMAGLLPYVMDRMPPKAGSGRLYALPTSGLKVCGHVRRIHLKRFHLPCFVPLTLAVQVCDGMCKDYIAEHGDDALTPQRKEPLTNEMIRLMFDLAHSGQKIGRRNIDLSHPGWASAFALFHVLAQTGMRKAEVSMPSSVKWDRSRISYDNVSFIINGAVVKHPSDAQLASLSDGDYLVLRPPPSKSDPLGLHWGSNPIYLRYSLTAKVNAARMVAAMMFVRKVPFDRYKDTPLFINFDGNPWRHHAITELFQKLLLASGATTEADLSKYSMHSWRIHLACALLAAGASNGTIQQLLRWRSDDALKIYARINKGDYADALLKASQATVDSVRTTSLREAMDARGLVDGEKHAAFYDAWLSQAAKATVHPSMAADLPVLSSDSYVAELHANEQTLVKLAEKLEKDGADDD
jgi:hypothetical protein